MNCKQCGRKSYFDEIFLDGLCTHCWNLKNPSESSNVYNYKCPDCKGEFNQPSSKIKNDSNGTDAYYSCPFCGKVMKGI